MIGKLKKTSNFRSEPFPLSFLLILLFFQAQKTGEFTFGAQRVEWKWPCWMGSIQDPSVRSSSTPDSWRLLVPALTRWAQAYLTSVSLISCWKNCLLFSFWLFKNYFLNRLFGSRVLMTCKGTKGHHHGVKLDPPLQTSWPRNILEKCYVVSAFFFKKDVSLAFISLCFFK